MPRQTITAGDGWVILTGGALAAATDFQVRQGTCLMNDAVPVDANDGFEFSANVPGKDSWFAALGKTIRVRTATTVVIQWGNLS